MRGRSRGRDCREIARWHLVLVDHAAEIVRYVCELGVAGGGGLCVTDRRVTDRRVTDRRVTDTCNRQA